MSEDPSADRLFSLAERALMLAGVVLLVVALVMASPLGFLFNDGDDGDEAAAANTPTSVPDDGTPRQEPAETAGTAGGTPTDADASGTPTMSGPVVATASPPEDSTPTPTPTEEPTPTPTEEPRATPTETDDGPGIGPPPGRGNDD